MTRPICVRELQLRNFTTHADTNVILPDVGVVLVTGENGAGKSSLIEAVAFAGWGKTLRGTNPWQQDTTGSLYAEISGIQIDRKIGATGAKKLSWSADGVQATHDTTSKRQEALITELGEFEVWRRTHVFSSSDAAHFSIAADAQRKKLIEKLLGLEIFEDASEKAKLAVKEAQTVYDLAATAVANARSSQQAREAVLESVESEPEEPMPEEPELPEDLPALKKELAAAELGVLELQRKAHDTANNAQRAMANASLEASKLELRLQEAKKALDRARAGRCPTCGQDVADDNHESKVLELSEALVAARSEATRVDNEGRKLSNEAHAKVQEARNSTRGIQQRVFTAERQASFRERWTQDCAAWMLRRDRRDSKIAEARRQLDASKAVLSVAQDELTKFGHALEIARAVDRVLGTRGVRASVITGALLGVETSANGWLEKLGGKAQISLRPYTETKSGSVNDAISLDVTGAGGGYGYQASSGGERKRIDVALLLALVELSTGFGAGTLFIDEVADSLDEAGVTGFCNLVQELAETRCVVVITHDVDIVGRLRPVLHLHAENGCISPR